MLFFMNMIFPFSLSFHLPGLSTCYPSVLSTLLSIPSHRMHNSGGSLSVHGGSGTLANEPVSPISFESGQSSESSGRSSAFGLSPVPPIVILDSSAPQNTDPMITRAKDGISMRKVLVASPTMSYDIPGSVEEALKDPQWKAAIDHEYQALLRNDTYILL
ncbi:hypothetical protein Syun_004317 [Stephania yunnanensis]|uniref:Uncharacterized protein n=1 Tax=Stephania yunnanensis TaxID=152371 RepID=A0AAP0L3R5_9MAGN